MIEIWFIGIDLLYSWFQYGSLVNSIFNSSLDNSMLLIHGLIIFPLTSISHAPQLPDKQPVGILTFAFFAFINQSSPALASVKILFGQLIFMRFFFKSEM